MLRAVFIALFIAVATPLAVAAPLGARPLPLIPTTPAPEQPPRDSRLRPRPWFYRQLDLQRQNVGLNGRKNAMRDEQLRNEWPEQHAWEARPLSWW